MDLNKFQILIAYVNLLIAFGVGRVFLKVPTTQITAQISMLVSHVGQSINITLGTAIANLLYNTKQEHDLVQQDWIFIIFCIPIYLKKKKPFNNLHVNKNMGLYVCLISTFCKGLTFCRHGQWIVKQKYSVDKIFVSNRMTVKKLISNK